MILTDNATYLHMPKTGGTWMRQVLKSIAVEEYDHAFPTEPSANIFTFVRNPWAWHVSTYNSIVFGSDISEPNLSDPVLLAYGELPTFSEFIEMQNSPSDTYKRKLLMALKINKASPSSIILAEQWLTSDLGWYQLMCNSFTKYATIVGRTENLADNLTTMMRVAGDTVPTTSLALPKVNVSNVDIDYRKMYSYELAQQVNASCRHMIEQYEYEF